MELPAPLEKLRAFVETIGAPEHDNNDLARNRRRAPAVLNDLRLAMSGENEAITGARRLSRLHAIDAVRAEQLVRVPQHVTFFLSAAAERNLPFLLRNVETKARFVYGVTREPHQVRGGRIGKRPFAGVNAVGIEETGPIHPQALRERVHLTDEKIDRRSVAGHNGLKRGSHVSRERVSSDVIGLDQRGVKEIAQGDSIAGLKTNEILTGADECFGRNRGHLVQVAGSFLGPIEHDHGCGYFGEASDLAFIFHPLLLEDKTSLRIDNGVGLRGLERLPRRKAEREREKSDEKAAHNHSNKNRSILIGAAWFATGESARFSERRREALQLLQRYAGARAVAESIRGEDEVDAFGRVHEIEGPRLAQATGPDRSGRTLKLAATRHVEFVNHDAFIDIGHAHMQREVGCSGAEVAEKETGCGAAAIQQHEFPFDQPAGARGFVIFQDSRRRNFLELLFQVAGKFVRGERLADRHFAIRIGLVADEDRVIDAERANVDRLGFGRADAAIGRHVYTLRIFRIGRSRPSGTARHIRLGDVHVGAGAKKEGGKNGEERFHNS